MSNFQILRIALPTPLPRLFDYLPPQGVESASLIPGVRVSVPFQSRKLVGVLIETDIKSDVPFNKLKRADAILDEVSIFSQDIYQLCQWAADYYHYSLGEVLTGALPTYLRKGKPVDDIENNEPPCPTSPSPHLLNTEQQDAVDAILEAREAFKIFMLDGVTGSGKTEVYLQVMATILQAGKQVLVLVPEISLTPQTISRFKRRFNDNIVALHSSLTEKRRYKAWNKARVGEARIVIGTRSAIFTPFANLGLIIVDEEHDASFKQQDRFRYHARDLSVMRASMLNIPVVLGSATPSLESLINVKRDRYIHLLLRERAGGAQLPTYQLVNTRHAQMQEGLSPTLIVAMREHLAKNNQVMLFLNRRGFAPALYCLDCGWIASCKRCDARMVYHRQPLRLHCHHCDSRLLVPKKCQDCKSERLETVGLGTQRLEQALKALFPHVPILRVDRDSTRRKGAMEDLLSQVHENQSAVLLGTQMLAKGHHFPQVTLVGIVDADTGLFSADFRAAEQMGQLLLQVSGRAGREEKAGTVIIQTKHPEHPLLQLLLEKGYAAFAESLLEERAKANLPPYSYFAIVRAEAYAEDNANDFLIKIKELGEKNDKNITFFGPVPALLAKKKGLYCKHLIIKAGRRSDLQGFIKGLMPHIPDQKGIKWIVDVDPIEV